MKDLWIYLSNNRAVSQIDMFPVTVELNPSDYYILKEIEGELELLGFKIHHSGKNKITINGQPSGTVILPTRLRCWKFYLRIIKIHNLILQPVQKKKLQQQWQVHQQFHMAKY